MADYQILSQDEQDDIVVSFMLSQERDKFCHELNMQRYDAMLKNVEGGEWKSQITKLRDQTAERLAEVRSIIAATKPQLPSAERMKAAKSRLSSRQTIPE